MPLSPPAKRRHLHTRCVECFGYQREDGLFDIEGHIVDTKTYDCADMEDVTPAGEAIHDMWLRLTLDRDFVIRDVDAAMDARPYTTCPQVLPDMRSLVGLRIGPGFKRQVKERIGGIKGCTHITELAGVLPTAAIQAFAGEVYTSHSSPEAAASEEQMPFQLDRCHALRLDGPAVARYYPRWYRPAAAKTGAAPKATPKKAEPQ